MTPKAPQPFTLPKIGTEGRFYSTAFGPGWPSPWRLAKVIAHTDARDMPRVHLMVFLLPTDSGGPVRHYQAVHFVGNYTEPRKAEYFMPDELPWAPQQVDAPKTPTNETGYHAEPVTPQTGASMVKHDHRPDDPGDGSPIATLQRRQRARKR